MIDRSKYITSKWTGTEIALDMSYWDKMYGKQAIRKEPKLTTIIKKKDLKFTDGYLEHDGTVVSPAFVKQYIDLEYLLQRKAWELEAKGSQENFEFKTSAPVGLIAVPTPATPLLDAEAEKADAISAENKKMFTKELVEDILFNYSRVVEFVCNSSVLVNDDDYTAIAIDCPTLGDPLKLTKDKLLDIVCNALGYSAE